jgi:hypothetical protein
MRLTTPILLLILLLTSCTVSTAQTVTPTIPAVYGGVSNQTVPYFNDGILQGVIDALFTNDTTTVNPGKAIYYLGKPYSMYIGNWWILIFLGVIGAIMWYSQGGSPYLLIMSFLVGNVVIWCFIPLDIVGSLTAIMLFSLSLILVAAFKGRSS